MSKGYLYAGTERKYFCLCGNEYDVYGRRDTCESACPGNAEEKCGGIAALSVYKTGIYTFFLMSS